jgi:hypothetical protein
MKGAHKSGRLEAVSKCALECLQKEADAGMAHRYGELIRVDVERTGRPNDLPLLIPGQLTVPQWREQYPQEFEIARGLFASQLLAEHPT